MSNLKFSRPNSQASTQNLYRQLRLVNCALWIVFLTACISAPVPTSILTPIPGVTVANPSSGPPIDTTQLASPASTATPATQTLRLWLPPQFAPTPDTSGGRVLLAQLAAFEAAHPGWAVEVRIKKPNGQGSLLHALQTALQAAPSTSPDVLALDGQSLAAAAPYLQPLTTRLPESELEDFYPFALQTARVNDQLLGSPFAAEVLGLAYSTSVYQTPPLSWNDVQINSGTFGLPLNDPMALVTLQNYVALGGKLTDVSGKPSIDPGTLSQVLAYYLFLQSNNALSGISLSATSPGELWAAYRESRVTATAVTSGDYLADRERLTGTAFTLLPTRDGKRATFASQWNYALAASDPARQLVALELILTLTAPETLGEWTRAANVLPARPSAMATWPNDTLRAILTEALLTAQPQPSPTILNVVGPPITAAVQVVLAGQASPETAAETAAQTIAAR